MPVKHFTERGTVLRPKSLENLVLASWRRARNNERDRWLEVTFTRRFAGKRNKAELVTVVHEIQIKVDLYMYGDEKLSWHAYGV